MAPIQPVFQTLSFEALTVNHQGEITQRTSHEARSLADDIGSGVQLEMIAIPGGIYIMGSPGRSGYEDERPHHLVTIKPFYLGRFTVTQEQWLAVMHKNLACRFQGPRRPVDRVSWNDAAEFCRRLSRLSGRDYRLPSESEWEFACRAQTGSAFHCGPTITTDLANYVGEHTFAEEPKGIYRHATTDVGSFAPNAYGLYDMHGNVWEWCGDSWHADYSGAPVDGSAWVSRGGEYRVVRGGSWHETPNHCRSAVRLKFAPDERDDFVGFRVALTFAP